MDSSNLLKLGLEDRNIRNKSDICTLLRMLQLLIRGSLVQAHPEAQRATFERVLRVFIAIYCLLLCFLLFLYPINVLTKVSKREIK